MSKAPNKPGQGRLAPGWRQQQRGASAVLVAVLLFALLSALLAALDVGRLYLAQRDMQRLANLAALDGARAIGGCRGALSDPQAEAMAAVRNSIQANGGNLAILDHSLSSVDLGVIGSSAGLRRFVASTPEDATAVNVTLVDPAPSRLLPMFSSGAGNLRVQAAASSAPMAALSVGTSLASLDPSDSALLGAVLGGLLGAPPGGLAIDIAGYKGLAAVQVTLQDLLDAGVVAGGVDGFLSADISAPVFLDALSDAVRATDPAAAAVVDQVAAVADPGRTVLPGELFAVEQGLEALASGLPVNALDVLRAVALAAGEGAPMSAPLMVNLPGVTSVTVQMRVIEPPQLGGPARPGTGADGQPRVQARSAQAVIQFDLDLEPINVNLPPLASVSLDADLHLYLTLAQATATMTELRCANPAQPFHSAMVDAQTSIATLGVGVFDDLGQPNPQPVPGPPLLDTNISILTLPPIGLRVDASAGPIDVGTGQSLPLLFQGPFVPQLTEPSADNTRQLGTPPGAALDTALLGLSDDLDLSVTLNLPTVGPLAGPLLNTVSGLLTSQVPAALESALGPVLSVLDSALLNPLLDGLGLSAGSAEVTVESVRISAQDPQFGGDRPYVELITH